MSTVLEWDRLILDLKRRIEISLRWNRVWLLLYWLLILFRRKDFTQISTFLNLICFVWLLSVNLACPSRLFSQLDLIYLVRLVFLIDVCNSFELHYISWAQTSPPDYPSCKFGRVDLNLLLVVKWLSNLLYSFPRVWECISLHNGSNLLWFDLYRLRFRKETRGKDLWLLNENVGGVLLKVILVHLPRKLDVKRILRGLLS